MAKKDKQIDYEQPLRSIKQENFCQEFLKDGNRHQAALRAGYSPGGARSNGSRLFDSTNIAWRIYYLRSQIAENCGLTVKGVVDDIIDTRKRAKEDKKYKAELTASDMLMRHLGGYERDNAKEVILIQRQLTEEEVQKRWAEKDAAGNGIDLRSIGQ